MGRSGTNWDDGTADSELFGALTLVLEQGVSLAKAAGQVEGVSRSGLNRAKNDPDKVDAWKAWRKRQKAKQLAEKKLELVQLIAHERLTIAAAAARIDVHKRTAFRWLAEPELRALLSTAAMTSAQVGAITLDDTLDALKDIGRDTAVEHETRVKALKAAGDLEVKRMQALTRQGTTVNVTAQAAAGAQAEAVAEAPMQGALEQVGAMLAQVAQGAATRRMAEIHEEVDGE